MTDPNVRKVESEALPAPQEWFDGQVEMEAVHVNDQTGTRQGRVHFHHGASTHWHLHMGDQVLYFVDGHGFAQEFGHDRIECEPGDIIEVPHGTRHIHGAMPGADAVHLAITQGETIWDHDPRYPGNDSDDSDSNA